MAGSAAVAAWAAAAIPPASSPCTEQPGSWTTRSGPSRPTRASRTVGAYAACLVGEVGGDDVVLEAVVPEEGQRVGGVGAEHGHPPPPPPTPGDPGPPSGRIPVFFNRPPSAGRSRPPGPRPGTAQGGRDPVHVDEGLFEQAEPEFDAQHPAHGLVDIGLVRRPTTEGLGVSRG